MIKTTTGFSPLQLFHGVEIVMSIKCKIPSLKLAIKLLPDTSTLDEHLLHLEHLYEQHIDVLTTNEEHKQWVNIQYDKSIKLSIYRRYILS